MITIQELLYNRGLPQSSRIKLVRHIDPRIDLRSLYINNKPVFLRYQNYQGNDVFKGCDYIVSFIGESNSAARFVGVFKIAGKNVGVMNYEEGDISFGANFSYVMEEQSGFSDLVDKVVVNWRNPRAWHQWIDKDMEIVELSPGLHYSSFTDYLDVILTYPELCEIINNSYPDWRIALSAVKGVYLITDAKTGKLYVGSAYGDDGIWGRWRDYVKSGGHGDNKSLRTLIDSNPDYAVSNLRFSILMLLPKTVTPDEAIRKEQLFKRKLGSNSFGLNNN